MTIIIRQQNSKEQNLLASNETESVYIHNLEYCELQVVPAPSKGWTIESIEGLEEYANACYDSWDMYLGNQWVGSSEV